MAIRVDALVVLYPYQVRHLTLVGYVDLFCPQGTYDWVHTLGG